MTVDEQHLLPGGAPRPLNVAAALTETAPQQGGVHPISERLNRADCMSRANSVRTSSVPRKCPCVTGGCCTDKPNS